MQFEAASIQHATPQVYEHCVVIAIANASVYIVSGLHHWGDCMWCTAQHMVHNYNTALRWSPLFQKQTTISPLQLPNTVMVIYTVPIHHQQPSPPCIVPSKPTPLGHPSYISRIHGSRDSSRTNYTIDVIANIQSAPSFWLSQMAQPAEDNI